MQEENVTEVTDSDFDLGEETREVSTAELDESVKCLVDARLEYDSKKRLATEANTAVELAETKVMELLKLSKKSSYKAEGLGTVSMFDKFSVKVPSMADDKDEFFAWIEETYGKDGLDKYRTVNSQALNSLYNAVLEEGVSEIPGIGLPSARTVIQFRTGR